MMSANQFTMSGDRIRLPKRPWALLPLLAIASIGLLTIVGIIVSIASEPDPTGVISNATWLGVALVGSTSVALLSFQLIGSKAAAWGAFIAVLLMLALQIPIISRSFSNL
jgi:hypothetical protein